MCYVVDSNGRLLDFITLKKKKKTGREFKVKEKSTFLLFVNKKNQQFDGSPIARDK